MQIAVNQTVVEQAEHSKPVCVFRLCACNANNCGVKIFNQPQMTALRTPTTSPLEFDFSTTS